MDNQNRNSYAAQFEENSLDAPMSVDDGSFVSQYASNGGVYSTESLEVNDGRGTPKPRPTSPMIMPRLNFSKRKALVVSMGIMLVVAVLMFGSLSLFMRKDANDQNSALIGPQQDVSLKDASISSIPKELQGAAESLLVNGDVVTRGNIKVANNGFVSVLSAGNLTANQSLTLPSGSGTLCLDSNNCNYAGANAVANLQNIVNNLQAQLSTIGPVPTAGVDSLNGQKGAVAIQGSLNQIAVSTSGGIITLSTPQNLDANANVQFGNLTVSPTGQITANKLVQTAAGNNVSIDAGNDSVILVSNGRSFQFPNSGVASQTICTVETPCALGGGNAVLLGQAAAQTDSTADTSIFINDTAGGALIRLQTGGVDQLVVANNGDTTIDGGLTVSGLGSGVVRSTGGVLSVGAVNLATEVSGVLAVTNGGTGANNAASARTNLGAAASGANGDITSTTALNTITPSSTLTIGAAGQTLALQGSGSSTFAAGTGPNITTVGFAGPSGSNTITFPALTGTVCLTSGNCAGVGGGITGSGTNGQVAYFNGSGTITSSANLLFNGSNLTATSFTGDGSALTNLNGSNVSSGTVANARLVNSGALTVTAGTGLSGGGAVALGASTSLAVVYGSTANTSVQGNTAVTITAGTGLTGGSTITLGAGGSSTLNVAYGSSAGTAVQGNTSLTCASGTGNLSGGGNTVTLGTGGSCNNLTITNSPIFSGTLAVQGATATIGADSQQGSVLLYDGGAGVAAHTGTVQVIGSLAQNTTYILPDPAAGSATICLSTGNCAGSGGGVTTPGGVNGNIAKFTGSGTIDDSTLSESGTTLTATGNFIIQGSNSLTLGTSSSLDGSVTFRTAGGANTVSLQAPTANPGSNLTFRLPSADGASGECLKTDASGNLSFGTCLSGGGGGGGVVSIDGLSGVVTISNATGSAGNITIDDATTAAKGIASFNTNNFSVTSGAVSIKTGGVGSTEIADGTVSGTDIATGTVTSGNITDGTIVDGDLQGGTYGSITGVGTLTAGTWNASTIAAQYGGTGISSYTTGDLLYASGATTLSKLAAVAAGQCLVSNGVGAAPIWSACPGAGGIGGSGSNGQVAYFNGGTSVTSSANLLFDGTNLTVGGTLQGTQLISTVTTGTAPFTVASTTVVTNLNADLLDGQHGAFYQNADNLNAGTVASARITGAYNGLTGSTALATVGTITAGTWQGGSIADAYLQDNITISSSGTVDWTALNNYPAACGAGQAITQLGDTITCTTFAAGSGSGNYIQNQNGSAQSSSNFWISGSGRADTSFLAPLFDTGSATALNIGTTNATVINLNKHVTVAAGQSLTLNGGNTASRNALTPAEGMVYFDTTTKQLLTYSNGKWQADRGDAIYVAASNSSQADKDRADYVGDGDTVAAADGDQVQINQALTAASGKQVILLAGTYVADATILVPNDTTLAGVGSGTVIELADIDVSDNLIEATGSNRTGQVIRNMKLDGRNDLNLTGAQAAVVMNGVGSYTAGRPGVVLSNLQIVRFSENAIQLIGSSENSIIKNNHLIGNGAGDSAIFIGSSFNIVTDNVISNNGAIGIYISGGLRNNVISNVISGNGSSGINLNGANNNTLSLNTIHDNAGIGSSDGIRLFSSDSNIITDNYITDTAGTGSAIDVFDAGSDANYLAGNYYSGTGASSINDASGGDTIYGGQVNGSTNFVIQPAGTIELMKNTNVTGTLNITSDVDTNGSLTVGNANQFVISNLGVVTSGTWQGTAITDTYVADTLTVNSSSTVDWQALNNYPAACGANQAISQLGDSVTCSTFAAGSGSGNYIQNQSGADQAADFRISGTGRANTALATPALRPVADSTTALKIQNAAGSTDIVTIDTTNGRVGIGTTPSYKLHVAETSTAVSGQNYSSYHQLDVAPDSAPAAQTNYTASYGLASTSSTNINANTVLFGSTGAAHNNGAGALGAAYGLFGGVYNSSNGTISTATGTAGQIFNIGSGSITTGTALTAGSPVVSAGAITNAIGLVINPQKVSGVANGFGVFQTGAADVNIFAGNTAIGSVSAPTATLDVTGTGKFSTSVLTPLVDTASAIVLNIGTTNATQINLNKNTQITGNLTVTQAGNVAFQRNTTDYTATGTQNDINFGTGALFRITSASALTITSIANPADGRVMTLMNASTFAVTINNDAGGTAANRVITGTGSNVTVPAGSSVELAYDSSASRWRIIGGTAIGTGNTAGRANSALNEGTMYYDTSTKQILTYANGKWQGDRGDAIYVAASNSSQADKDRADYVGDGNTGAAGDGDQVEINQALTAASGKKVVLLAGTYVADATILVPNNTIFSGVGNGTIIELADLDATDNLIENSDTTTGAGVVIRDLKIDGRRDLNTAGTQIGIYLSGMGDSATLRPGSTITGVSGTRFRDNTVYLFNSGNNLIISNSINASSSSGQGAIRTEGSNNTVSNNNISGVTTAISIESGSNNIISNNIISSITNWGVRLNGSSNNNVIDNTIRDINGTGIVSITGSNTIRGNVIVDSGNTLNNDAINLLSSSNVVTNNTISDGTHTVSNNSILINAGSNTNYLADNTLGGGIVNDLGTGTVYGGQVDGGNDIILQPTAATDFVNVLGGSLKVGNGTPDVALNGEDLYVEGTLEVDGAVRFDTALSVTSGGTGNTTYTTNGVFYYDGTKFVSTAAGATGQCFTGNTGAAPTWGGCGVSQTLQTAYDNSTNPATILLADGKNVQFTAADTATTDPSIIMKLNCTACGTGATGNFLIQNNSSATLFSVAGSGAIQIGTASNGISLAGSGGTTNGSFTLSGTARNTKSIVLAAEYAGSVLDAASDTGGPVNCATNNSGTMTSGFDAANRRNYYNWTSSQTSDQCYDVVVQVPMPTDWDGWNTGSGNSIDVMVKSSNVSNSAYAIGILDTTGTADANYGAAYTSPGTLTTSWADMATSDLSGTYAASDGTTTRYLTIKIRMTAKNSANLQLDNITLRYYSKF